MVGWMSWSKPYKKGRQAGSVGLALETPFDRDAGEERRLLIASRMQQSRRYSQYRRILVGFYGVAVVRRYSGRVHKDVAPRGNGRMPRRRSRLKSTKDFYRHHHSVQLLNADTVAQVLSERA